MKMSEEYQSNKEFKLTNPFDLSRDTIKELHEKGLGVVSKKDLVTYHINYTYWHLASAIPHEVTEQEKSYMAKMLMREFIGGIGKPKFTVKDLPDNKIEVTAELSVIDGRKVWVPQNEL